MTPALFILGGLALVCWVSALYELVAILATPRQYRQIEEFTGRLQNRIDSAKAWALLGAMMTGATGAAWWWL
jgi:hypothetical protein